MRAVLTVVGKDCVGILAKVSTKCAEFNINVIEVTQSVLQDVFCMIMLVDISNISASLSVFGDDISKLGREMGMDIRVMHEDIFNSMHRV